MIREWSGTGDLNGVEQMTRYPFEFNFVHFRDETLLTPLFALDLYSLVVS